MSRDFVPTSQQIDLLAFIFRCHTEDPPFTPTLSDIALEFGTNRGTAQMKVDRLVHQGCLEKMTNGTVARLRLTGRARALLEEHGIANRLDVCCRRIVDLVREWGVIHLHQEKNAELAVYLRSIEAHEL